MKILAVQMMNNKQYFNNLILWYTLVHLVHLVLYLLYLLYFRFKKWYIRTWYTGYTLVHLAIFLILDQVWYIWYSNGTDGVNYNIMYCYLNMVQAVQYRWYRWYRWYTSDHTHTHTHTPNHTHTLTFKIITS